MCAADGGQDHGRGLCFWWEGAHVDIWLAHRLPGEASRGHTPHGPFDELSR